MSLSTESMKVLCAKEVGSILGVNGRTAARLMRTHKIKAFRLSDNGPWRTTGGALGEYIMRELERQERERTQREAIAASLPLSA